MRVALVGCGMMGRAAAWAAVHGGLGVEHLLLSDRDEGRAHALADWLGDGSHPSGIEVAGIGEAVTGADVVASAAPWDATAALARTCAEARRALVWIARPDYGEIEGVGASSGSAGVPLLGPVGLEPGLVELLAREAASEPDMVEEVASFCGGLPVDPRPPLHYVASFGGGQRLPIALKDAYRLAAGRLVTVERFSGVEMVEVEGLGRLEAYHDGLLPWLADDPVLGAAATITQKTLRWPGFAETVRTLGRLGLLGDEPVAGSDISPREMVERVVAPATAWSDGDADTVVVRCVARGRRHGRALTSTVELRDHLDPVTGLSAMARTTGFTLAACAALLASGRLAGAGWLRPNEALAGEHRRWLCSWLRSQGVAIYQGVAIDRDVAGTVPAPAPCAATDSIAGVAPAHPREVGPLDAVGVGIGPSNLSLAALLEPAGGVRTRFFDRKPHFSWHAGLMLPGASVQVHWLKDLVSLVDPTSRFSFLAFLAAHGRLYRVLNTRRTSVPRREFEQYYQWVADQLPNLRFGVSVEAVELAGDDFAVHTGEGVVRARNLVLGVGPRPRLPDAVRGLVDGSSVLHASELVGPPRCYEGRRIAVVGGGQTGAEVVRYLLGDHEFPPAKLVWASRRANFEPLDDSPFVNEYFTPNYSAYFHSLDRAYRSGLLEHQRLASDGISSELLLDIYRRLYDLDCFEGLPRRWRLLPGTRLVGAERDGKGVRLTWESRAARWQEPFDLVVCATGYEQALPACVDPLRGSIALADGLPVVERDFSLRCDGPADRRIFVQNIARHAFGVADPNLSLLSWRSAIIANKIADAGLYEVGDVSAAVDWGSLASMGSPVGDRTGGTT